MIPPFDAKGLLPAGIHPAGWQQFTERFGFSDRRAAQKAKYGGELFPAELPEGLSGRTFLEFFQADRDTGAAKGIVSIDLGAQNFSLETVNSQAIRPESITPETIKEEER